MHQQNNLSAGVLATGLLLAVISILTLGTLIWGISMQALAARAIAEAVLIVLISLFGAFYVFTGCRKQTGGVLFRIYLAMNAVGVLFLLTSFTTAFSNVLFACYFAGFCILAVASDLGEVKSKIIAFAIAVCQLALFIKFLLSGAVTLPTLVPQLSNLVLFFSVAILMCAKYADKKARGSR